MQTFIHEDGEPFYPVEGGPRWALSLLAARANIRQPRPPFPPRPPPPFLPPAAGNCGKQYLLRTGRLAATACIHSVYATPNINISGFSLSPCCVFRTVSSERIYTVYRDEN